MRWKDLENATPELATFGLKRFEIGVAYLATGSAKFTVDPATGHWRLNLPVTRLQTATFCSD
jgi:hypothetical protein